MSEELWREVSLQEASRQAAGWPERLAFTLNRLRADDRDGALRSLNELKSSVSECADVVHAHDVLFRVVANGFPTVHYTVTGLARNALRAIRPLIDSESRAADEFESCRFERLMDSDWSSARPEMIRLLAPLCEGLDVEKLTAMLEDEYSAAATRFGSIDEFEDVFYEVIAVDEFDLGVFSAERHWWKDEPAPPDWHQEVFEGEKKQVARWYGRGVQALEKAAKDGKIWLRKLDRYRWTINLRHQRDFEFRQKNYETRQ